MTKVLLTILFLTMTAAAQTQIHVAGSIGASVGLGFANPTVGANAGIETRKGKIGFSGDFNIDRIRKTVGGSGAQFTGRESLRIFKDKLFVQGGAQESYYRVRLFSKSAFAPLVGIGWASKNTIIEANFLADVTSPNRGRTAQFRATFYLPKHWFLRVSSAVDNFVQGKQRMTGFASRAEVGLYW